MLDTVWCTKCGSKNSIRKYALDNLYVCADCGHIKGYECHGCDRFYDYNNLALLDGKYVCKTCGKIQWGYTEYKNDSQEVHS